MSEASPNLNLLIGSILIATWVNMSLYTVELMLARRYWRTNKNDTTFNRMIVATLLVADTLSSITGCCLLYYYCVMSFGKLERLLDFTVLLPIDMLATGASGALVEGFLIYRVYRLIGTMWPGYTNYLVASVLAIANIASFSACVWFIVIVRIYPTMADRWRLARPLIWWLASVTGIDSAVALILTYLLWKIKNTVKDFGQSRSDGVMQRLIRVSVASGAIPAANALTALLCYKYTSKTLNMCTALGMIAGRLYSLSLIGNLLMRNHLTSEPPSSLPLDTTRQAENGSARAVTMGITVTQRSEVNFDGDVNYDMGNFGRRKTLTPGFITQNPFPRPTKSPDDDLYDSDLEEAA